jgi:hypothetical protein
MTEPKEFLIRVGEIYFVDPHYVHKITSKDVHVSPTSLAKPKTWKSRQSANLHMSRVRQYYPSAEIEIRYLNKGAIHEY